MQRADGNRGIVCVIAYGRNTSLAQSQLRCATVDVVNSSQSRFIGTPPYLPVTLAGSPALIAVGSSGRFVCVLRADGSVLCAAPDDARAPQSLGSIVYAPNTTYQFGLGRAGADGLGWRGSSRKQSISNVSTVEGFAAMSLYQSREAEQIVAYFLTRPHRYPTAFLHPVRGLINASDWNFDAPSPHYTAGFCTTPVPMTEETGELDRFRSIRLQRDIPIANVLKTPMQSVCGDGSKSCGLMDNGSAICWTSLAGRSQRYPTFSPPGFLQFSEIACGFDEPYGEGLNLEEGFIASACGLIATIGLRGRILCWPFNNVYMSPFQSFDVFWYLYEMLTDLDVAIQAILLARWKDDLGPLGYTQCMERMPLEIDHSAVNPLTSRAAYHNSKSYFNRYLMSKNPYKSIRCNSYANEQNSAVCCAVLSSVVRTDCFDRSMSLVRLDGPFSSQLAYYVTPFISDHNVKVNMMAAIGQSDDVEQNGESSLLLWSAFSDPLSAYNRSTATTAYELKSLLSVDRYYDIMTDRNQLCVIIRDEVNADRDGRIVCSCTDDQYRSLALSTPICASNGLTASRYDRFIQRPFSVDTSSTNILMQSTFGICAQRRTSLDWTCWPSEPPLPTPPISINASFLSFLSFSGFYNGNWTDGNDKDAFAFVIAIQPDTGALVRYGKRPSREQTWSLQYPLGARGWAYPSPSLYDKMPLTGKYTQLISTFDYACALSVLGSITCWGSAKWLLSWTYQYRVVDDKAYHWMFATQHAADPVHPKSVNITNSYVIRNAPAAYEPYTKMCGTLAYSCAVSGSSSFSQRVFCWNGVYGNNGGFELRRWNISGPMTARLSLGVLSWTTPYAAEEFVDIECSNFAVCGVTINGSIICSAPPRTEYVHLDLHHNFQIEVPAGRIVSLAEDDPIVKLGSLDSSVDTYFTRFRYSQPRCS